MACPEDKEDQSSDECSTYEVQDIPYKSVGVYALETVVKSLRQADRQLGMFCNLLVVVLSDAMATLW